MAATYSNVGRPDVLARRLGGWLLLLGGLASLEKVFFAMPLITWIVLAGLFHTGLFFLIGGLREGTGFFGLLLMVLAALDAWLALQHHGELALAINVVAAGLGFLTAHYGWCPVNALLHKNSHCGDEIWFPHGTAGVH